MDKRERVFRMIEGNSQDGYIPAAFFLHFDPLHHKGQEAVDRHLDYFEYTGMDIMKVQYEHHFPPNPSIVEPSDWRTLKPLDREFFEDPLSVVRGVVAGVGAEAPVIVTLYSPFMFASQITSRELLREHLDKDPSAVKTGIDIVVESVLQFVHGCIDAGVDGFYASTQGGEDGFLSDPVLFDRYIKPTDLAVWDVIDKACDLNILHICDYEGPYASLEPYADYPGQIVNSPIEFASGDMSPTQISAALERPFMGGMNRHGALAHGPAEAISAEVESVLADIPDRFILAADCTVPGDTPWEHIATAVECAHRAGGDK